MPEEFTAHYRWTVEELRRANRWHSRQRSPWAVWSNVLAIGAVLTADGAFLASHAGLTGLAIINFALGFYYIAYPAWSQTALDKQLRRKHAQNTNRDAEVEWQIAEQGLRVTNNHSIIQMQWQAFNKVLQTPEGVLLYQSPLLFYWLPLDGFTNHADFEAVAAMARRHIPSFRQIGG